LIAHFQNIAPSAAAQADSLAGSSIINKDFTIAAVVAKLGAAVYGYDTTIGNTACSRYDRNGCAIIRNIDS
jgi:hypothetical protein